MRYTTRVLPIGMFRCPLFRGLLNISLLFAATKDKFHAAKLQLWLCHLQLRLAIPQAALAARTKVETAAILRGLSDSTPAKDTLW